MQTVICGLLGFFVSWALIRMILRRSIWFGAMGGQRQFHQTHSTPIPRFGGVALAAAFAAVAAAALLVFVPTAVQDHELLAIVVCALAMFAVGFVDDLTPIGAKAKLGAQVLIAIVACNQGVNIQSLKNPLTGVDYQLGLLVYPASVFWLVAVTNLINLIDGLDGLAGGIGFMVMCLLAYVGLQVELNFTILVAVGMAGALLGFLYYNFPPAKIYMGDGGAYLLGFLIGSLALQSSNKGTVFMALLAPMFALAVPIVDVALAIMRRGVRGLPIFRPDRKHIHHRLTHLGLSPLQVVLVLYGLSLIFLVMGFSLFWTEGRLLPLWVGVSALIIIVGIRSLGWVHDWLTVRHMVGGASQTRRDVQYALALCQWFDLSAARTQTPDELWEDFTFCARKLGFSRVCVRQGETARAWTDGLATESDLTDRHDMNIEDVPYTVEFHGRTADVTHKTFFLLTELAAESWLRAVRRWQQTHEVALQLAPGSPGAKV